MAWRSCSTPPLRAGVRLQVQRPGVGDRPDERVVWDLPGPETRRPVSSALIFGSKTMLDPGCDQGRLARRAGRAAHIRALPGQPGGPVDEAGGPGTGWSWTPELLVTSGSLGPVGSVGSRSGRGSSPRPDRTRSRRRRTGCWPRVRWCRRSRRSAGRPGGRVPLSPGAGALLKLLPIVNGGLASSKVMSIRPPSLNAGDASMSGM